MRRLVAQVVVAIVLLLATSAPAHAGPWGWLDKLSGPGGFTSAGRVFFPIPIVLTDKNNITPLAEGIEKRHLYIVLETTRFVSVEPHEDTRFHGQVNVATFQGVAYVPLSTIPNTGDWLRSVDVGAGIGKYRLYGTGVKEDGVLDGAIWKWAIPFRLKFTPSELFVKKLRDSKWRNGLSSLSYVVGMDILAQTLEANDFDTTHDAYRVRGETLVTYGLVFDLTSAFFHVKKRGP